MSIQGYNPPMTLHHDKQIQMRASEEFINSIDDWRRKQPDLPSRAEAIRRLIKAGIECESVIDEAVRLLSGFRDSSSSPEIESLIEQIKKVHAP